MELISYDRDQQGLSLHLVASRKMENKTVSGLKVLSKIRWNKLADE